MQPGLFEDPPRSDIETPPAEPTTKAPTWRAYSGKRTACEVCAQIDIESRRRHEGGVPCWPARWIRTADGVAVKHCVQHAERVKRMDRADAAERRKTVRRGSATAAQRAKRPAA